MQIQDYFADFGEQTNRYNCPLNTTQFNSTTVNYWTETKHYNL